MRILTYGLSTNKMAGIETFLLNMNKYMSNDCIFDYVIESNPVTGSNTIHQTALDEKGSKTFYIAPKQNILRNIRDWISLLRRQKSNYQIAYFNVYSLSRFFLILICKWSGLRVVVHAHNNQLHKSGVLKMLHKVGRFIISKVDVVRLTNSTLSSKFMFGDTERETLIYNAIAIERFGFSRDSRERIRTELNLTDKHVYGFAGRIAYQKNPLFLIELFDLIRIKDDCAVLMMAGDGNLMDEVKAAVREKDLTENVLLLGSVHNVEEYYQAMDVFLLPSLFEGLGIVLIEAQAAGLPCISSANVVPKEAKVTELLEYVPLSQPEKWAETAIEMAQRKIEREKYKPIIENTDFNIEREAKRLESILASNT